MCTPGLTLPRDSDSSTLIGSVKQDMDLVLGKIFVGCLSAPLPVSIVINDKDTAGRQTWIEMHKLMPR
jgi:hypothetical protein